MDQDCREQIYSEDYFDVLFEYSTYRTGVVNYPDICYLPINATHSVAFIPIQTFPKDYIQRYGYGTIPNCFGLMDLSSMEASGISQLQNIPTLNLRGQGVLVAVIDSGIDYTHEAFIRADGTTKILSIWDQTIQSDATPEGIPYGTVYTMDQINEALRSTDPFSIVPSRDEIGHGTFASGIIVGERNEENRFSGIVPDAELIVVKLKQAKANLKEFFSIPPSVVCFQENDIMFGLRYVTDLAAQLQRPISIYLGLGSNQGAHDGRGALSNYCTRIADTLGTAVSIAVGNEGNSRLHYMGTITQRNEFQTVELRVGPNEYGFTMELWGDAPNTFSIDIQTPSGEFIPRIPARIGETREIRFIFEQTIILVDYHLVESETGDQLILLRFRNPSEGIWRFGVYATGSLNKTFHIWLPIHTFLTSDTYFTEANPDYTVTSPGTATLPIVPTAYDPSNNSVYIQASRGFTRNDYINPVLAAPGVNIIGPGLDHNYVTASGTSIAAAHTAGIAAFILEWGILRGNDINMDSQDIKNFLIRGARRDPNQDYPNKEIGYGFLDVYNSFISLRGESPV